MISPELIQKAVIAKLKANTALVTALGSADKIKESQYQSTDFVYPAVRVDINEQTPIGNGVDHLKLSTVGWSVRVYSEKDSSFEANDLLGLVLTALFNTQIIDATDENSVPHFTMIRIDVTTTQNAIRTAERLWFAEAFFESVIHPLVSPI